MILDGRVIAEEICKEIRQNITTSKARPPGLAFLLIGEHPPSQIYVEAKQKKCREIGIRSSLFIQPASTPTKVIVESIRKLNQDREIDGILVQLPLPSHISQETIIHAIDPNKDVDGFHPLNIGKLALGINGGFIPCTPAGIVELLKRNHISCTGKHAVILGRSNIVGKPLALLLMQKREGLNATVTLSHSQSANLQEICRSADILIAAMGVPHYIGCEMVKDGAIVIDVGINRIEGRLIGDVQFAQVAPHCSYITPVPGGIGPMTIAMLLQNTWLSYTRHL
jgi:methylenetetrahydrofolate dehydrogenase (NADP+)/methenyltetrahydrofolate cyclohydrolase